jgi:hypothetical protein
MIFTLNCFTIGTDDLLVQIALDIGICNSNKMDDEQVAKKLLLSRLCELISFPLWLWFILLMIVPFFLLRLSD